MSQHETNFRQPCKKQCRGRILLADDDTDLLRSLTQGLRRAGFEVVAKSGGNDALIATREEVFDAIILDVVMEHGEGVETLLRLREELPHLPIIAISGDGLYLQNMSIFGACDTLQKPFRQSSLIDAIDNVIASQTREFATS